MIKIQFNNFNFYLFCNSYCYKYYDFSKPPLLLSFNVYIRASKNYTTADEMPLYKSMRTRYQEILRDGNILTRLPRGTPLRFIRSLKIRSTG